MATPVILYSSAGVPVGSRLNVIFYRPTSTSDGLTPANTIADVMAAGVLTNAVGVAAVIENVSMDLNSSSVDREGTYGEDTDFREVRKRPMLNLTAQIGSYGTPTICPGDYIEIIIGLKITSTAATPVPMATSRWVVTGNGVSNGQNQAGKFGLKLKLDRQNSGALTEF